MWASKTLRKAKCEDFGPSRMTVLIYSNLTLKSLECFRKENVNVNISNSMTSLLLCFHKESEVLYDHFYSLGTTFTYQLNKNNLS